MMTSNMSLIQEAFKDESRVLLLSHSVTPEYDSVPVLKDYAKEKEVLDNKWHLVTGDRKVIYDPEMIYYYIGDSVKCKIDATYQAVIEFIENYE